MPHRNLAAVFESITVARAARAALVDAGLGDDRMVLSADLTQDPIGSEAPGQSYENQPGQPASDSAAAAHSEAVRSGGCVLSVRLDSANERPRVETLLRSKGARRTCEYRDDGPPHGAGNGVSDERASQIRSAEAPPRAEQPGDSEARRIAFLVHRDGEPAARAWVERTLHLYREAVAAKKSHAARPDYQPLFEASIRTFEQWLKQHSPRIEP
jgi:hypothetical protein